MADPLLSSDLSLDEEEKLFTVNLSLQQDMLFLVEHRHNPDHQATLERSLAALEDVLNKRQTSGAFADSIRDVLTRVLSACHDVSRGKTIARVQAGFAVMDAQLSSQHEERRRREHG